MQLPVSGWNYWRPDDGMTFEPVFVDDDLKTFYGAGCRDMILVGFHYWEEWGGPVPSREEYLALKASDYRGYVEAEASE